MNTTTASSSDFLPKADRVGVAASVLCAIHCAVSPILLLALPAFGKIWAHPASHILVALFVVPLAAFSIWKGYRSHRKLWVVAAASLGIFFVLGGAALPAFAKEAPLPATPAASPAPAEAGAVDASCCEVCAEEAASAPATPAPAEPAACVDACCPSVQISETGEASLHIPPAAIVTTLGGLFLIAAHVGNLCLCGHACRNASCASC
ncbi:MAG: MerC domain-containing protein [Verrucomicrobiota bacterium JB023]|nr:MerC domain-containing protein [Verrucomicrobiota bacterium JB023]